MSEHIQRGRPEKPRIVSGRMSVNKYGTPISVHVCAHCGAEFTVCPPVEAAEWGRGCLAEGCSSYDSKRDADRFFE